MKNCHVSLKKYQFTTLVDMQEKSFPQDELPKSHMLELILIRSLAIYKCTQIYVAIYEGWPHIKAHTPKAPFTLEILSSWRKEILIAVQPHMHASSCKSTLHLSFQLKSFTRLTIRKWCLDVSHMKRLRQALYHSWQFLGQDHKICTLTPKGPGVF
jgi:hypothetical protein